MERSNERERERGGEREREREREREAAAAWGHGVAGTCMTCATTYIDEKRHDNCTCFSVIIVNSPLVLFIQLSTHTADVSKIVSKIYSY
jgi:hypothetical protein